MKKASQPVPFAQFFPTVDPNDTIIGTVTITPTDSDPPFELSGSGTNWSIEEGEIVLTASLRTLYVLTFALPASGSYGFASPGAEISHNGQNAFICSANIPGASAITLSFINDVSAAFNYDLGFRIIGPEGSIIPWDPQVAFNPPDIIQDDDVTR